MKSRRMDLDFVRGVAIFLALGWHFNGRETGLFWLDVILVPGKYLGWAGVDLFFVLSGFLVGGLILSEINDTGRLDARRFIVRRVFKIWPVLYLYIGLLISTGRYDWSVILPQTLLHVQNYWKTPVSHLWSLAVEEHFYIAAALLLSWGSAVLRKPGNRALYILGAGMALALVARVVAMRAGEDGIDLQTHTHFRFDSLCMGVVLAYLRIFRPDAFESLHRPKAVLALICLALVALLLVLQAEPRLKHTFGYTVAYLGAAAFVLLFFGVEAMNSWSFPVRMLAWVGVYSYPIYVFQFVPIRAIEALWSKLVLHPMQVWQNILFSYLGAIIFSVLVSKLVEQPMVSLRDRLFPEAGKMV